MTDKDYDKLINAASKKLGSSPDKLKSTLEKGDISALSSGLSKSDKAMLRSVLSDKELQKIKAYGVNAKTERLMITLAEYYIANKEPDCDWIIMPRTNISAYLGSATYMESYENKMPEGFMEKKPEMGGVSAVRINL